MTDFVRSFSTQHLLPPWQTRKSRFWTFVVHTEQRCMQDYLDSHLNAAAPDRAPYYYTAQKNGGYGMLVVADHSDFSSDYGGSRRWSTVAHREIFWAFPAERWTVSPENVLILPKTVWIQPFYYDDSSFVMFSSREIWGGEKQMGRIELSEGEHVDDLHVDLSIAGFREFSPKAREEQISVMHLRMDHTETDVDLLDIVQKRDHDLSLFYGAQQRGIPALTYANRLAGGEDPVTTSMYVDTLKQFRDVFDMREAVERSIVSSKVTHKFCEAPRVFSSENIRLDLMWSDTMKEQYIKLFGVNEAAVDPLRTGHAGVGLRNEEGDANWGLPRIPVDVVYGVYFTSDARFEVLDTLHTYGAAPVD